MAQGTTPVGGDNGHAGETDEQREQRIDQLMADIEKTRGEMSQTVVAIEERLSPAHLKEQLMEQLLEAKENVKQELREEWRDAKENVLMGFDEAKSAVRTATIGRVENMFATTVDTIKQNPIPTALTGLGVMLLIMNRRAERRRFYDEMSFEYPRQTSGITESVKETSARAKQKVSEAADRSKQAAMELAHRAQDRTREIAQGARRLEYRFEHSVRDNPLAYAAIALALGAAVGLSIPRTEVEDRYLGEARDPAPAEPVT